MKCEEVIEWLVGLFLLDVGGAVQSRHDAGAPAPAPVPFTFRGICGKLFAFADARLRVSADCHHQGPLPCLNKFP
jgi:hypothetical protein